MSEPLISVIMPCYNATSTLLKAFASLLTQTYQNWECIFVDDGSTDHPQKILDQISDPRIHSLTLQRNYGRGVARQVALDHARGKYLCMLDADDWYYPDKLQQQLVIMEEEKQLVLLSNPMASINRQGEMVGVHRHHAPGVFPSIQKFYPRLARIPVPHSPSMIRMNVAQQTRFRSRFRQAEDSDWLLKILWDRYYAVLPTVAYAYNEYVTSTEHKTLQAYQYHMLMNWVNRHSSWPFACACIVETWLKQTLFRIAFPLGFADYLISLRSTKPSMTDLQNFSSAHKQVEQKLLQLNYLNF